MNWLEVHIDTNHAGLEPVEAMLSSLDVDGVVIDDETEFREFLEDNRQYWDYVDEDLSRRMEGLSRVTFYLQSDEAGFAKLGEVRLALEDLRAQGQDWGSLMMSLDNLADEDWENNWKQYYKPIEIGDRLLVVPKWEDADPGKRVPLYLDPSAPGTTPPPGCASPPWKRRFTAGSGCWTWAAAAAFYPSPL